MEKTINSCLIEAIHIMDKKGRSAHKTSGDSVLLWQKDWDCLRTKLINAFFLHNEKIANHGIVICEDSMQNELLAACKYLTAFVPDWAKVVPGGLDPTFYGTLSSAGDLTVKQRVDEIKKMIEKADNNRLCT